MKSASQQKASHYFRTKTMIHKMTGSIVLLAFATLTAYDAQAAKLPPFIKIVSAQGATYFIDPGKISSIVNSYVLVREKTTEPGEIGVRAGTKRPHLLGIPGFPGGIPIDGDAKDFIKSNHLESKFVTVHQASLGQDQAMNSVEPVYVRASAVSAIEIPDQNKPVCPKGSKKPLDNSCRDERVKATIYPGPPANIGASAFQVTEAPEEVKKLIDDIRVTQESSE
jgi:hypothetical protein